MTHYEQRCGEKPPPRRRITFGAQVMYTYGSTTKTEEEASKKISSRFRLGHMVGYPSWTTDGFLIEDDRTGTIYKTRDVHVVREPYMRGYGRPLSVQESRLRGGRIYKEGVADPLGDPTVTIGNNLIQGDELNSSHDPTGEARRLAKNPRDTNNKKNLLGNLVDSALKEYRPQIMKIGKVDQWTVEVWKSLVETCKKIGYRIMTESNATKTTRMLKIPGVKREDLQFRFTLESQDQRLLQGIDFRNCGRAEIYENLRPRTKGAEIVSVYIHNSLNVPSDITRASKRIFGKTLEIEELNVPRRQDKPRAKLRLGAARDLAKLSKKWGKTFSNTAHIWFQTKCLSYFLIESGRDDATWRSCINEWENSRGMARRSDNVASISTNN